MLFTLDTQTRFAHAHVTHAQLCAHTHADTQITHSHAPRQCSLTALRLTVWNVSPKCLSACAGGLYIHARARLCAREHVCALCEVRVRQGRKELRRGGDVWGCKPAFIPGCRRWRRRDPAARVMFFFRESAAAAWSEKWEHRRVSGWAVWTAVNSGIQNRLLRSHSEHLTKCLGVASVRWVTTSTWLTLTKCKLLACVFVHLWLW